MSVGSIPRVFALAVFSLPSARAQSALVRGQVVLRDDGQPLPYTTVALVSQGSQRLTSDSGRFVLADLPPGEVRLRFKRIGFVAKDTVLVLAPGAAVRIRVEMTRMAIPLAGMVVSGRCTNETPFEPKSAVLAQLIEQVNQNAERMRLLATARPFIARYATVDKGRDPKRPSAELIDTIYRGPLPFVQYEPKDTAQPRTPRTLQNSRYFVIPELASFSDTAFSNNHCFHYAGQKRLDTDSVVAVDFEPVPRLDKARDIAGTIFLRLGDYQLFAVDSRMTHMEPGYYSSRTRFKEIVSGIPILFQWELRRLPPRFTVPIIQTGHLIDILWTDSARAKVDTSRRFRRW